MQSGLEDKVVLITGAAGGIGRALAGAFADERARLILCANANFAELERLATERGWRERARLVRADVTRGDELLRALEPAFEHFGRVDVCVPNAGAWPAEDVPLQELSEERLRRTVEINLLGAAFTARAFLRALACFGPRPSGEGASICFLGSTAGRFGERYHADYALAKAGLVGLVHTLKNEITQIDPYGRVNMVEPGWTVTEMVRPALQDDRRVARVLRTMALRQLARAQDIANSVLLLSAPLLSRHTTGQILTVAGGMEGRLLWEQSQIDVNAVRGRLQP